MIVGKSQKILCNLCHEESRPRMWRKVVTNSFSQWEGRVYDIRPMRGQNSVTQWQRRMLCSVLSRLLEHVPRSEYSELSGSGMYLGGERQSTTGASWHKLRRHRRDASQWWGPRMTGVKKTMSRRRMTTQRSSWISPTSLWRCWSSSSPSWQTRSLNGDSARWEEWSQTTCPDLMWPLKVCKLWRSTVLRLRWLRLVTWERMMHLRLPLASSLHETGGKDKQVKDHSVMRIHPL